MNSWWLLLFLNFKNFSFNFDLLKIFLPSLIFSPVTVLNSFAFLVVLSFKSSDLQTLNDIIEINDFDNSMNAFELGTQTWNDGRLRFLVAGYYFSGVETPIHTLPESIGNLDDLRKLYLEENNITILPDSFSNLTALVQLYISFNQIIK